MYIFSDFVTGTGLFQLKHLILLIVSLILIAVLSILAIKKNLSITAAHRILLVAGVLGEMIKCFTYTAANEASLGGYLPKTDLPFQLCSMQVIFIIILNFTKNEKIQKLLHSFMIPTCLVGGIAAMIFATSSSRTMPMITIQYFVFHIIISAFAIYLLANKEIKFTIKDYVKTLVMLTAIFFVAMYLNSILYTPKWIFNTDTGLYEASEYLPVNFMYVINPPAEGLPFLNKDHGWLVYIVHYMFAAFVAVTACFIKPIINWFKEKKSCKEQKA